VEKVILTVIVADCSGDIARIITAVAEVR